MIKNKTLYATGDGIINAESKSDKKVDKNTAISTVEVNPVATAQPNSLGGLNMPMIIGMYALFAVAYILMSRSQKKKKAIVQKMQDEIASGDEIYTSSGFFGKVVSVEEERVIVEFGTNKGINIPVSKREVFKVITK